VMDSLGSNKFV